MNTSENQWKKSSFVSAAHVLQHPHHSAPRHGKRLTGIVRAHRVKEKETPVVVGAAQEKIQIFPVVQDGQVKALRVSCACGCESTFDIQYAAGGTNHDQQTAGPGLHPGSDGQRMQDPRNYAA